MASHEDTPAIGIRRVDDEGVQAAMGIGRHARDLTPVGLCCDVELCVRRIRATVPQLIHQSLTMAVLRSADDDRGARCGEQTGFGRGELSRDSRHQDNAAGERPTPVRYHPGRLAADAWTPDVQPPSIETSAPVT